MWLAEDRKEERKDTGGEDSRSEVGGGGSAGAELALNNTRFQHGRWENTPRLANSPSPSLTVLKHRFKSSK